MHIYTQLVPLRIPHSVGAPEAPLKECGSMILFCHLGEMEPEYWVQTNEIAGQRCPASLPQATLQK